MGRSSGKKRAAVLGFLGFTAAAETMTTGRYEPGLWQRSQQHLQQRHGGPAAAASDAPWTTARPSGGDDQEDVDRRASEFINKVHRRMLGSGGGDAAPLPES
ncbi:unnamed protein product [Urochloa decumbens]|uniref:Uncharacterized protein n=1 Tax=Urochloa decumbens TaxID=240449 RepID=A0ABC8VS55_9POAL